MCGACRSGRRPKIASSGTSVRGSNCRSHRVNERSSLSRRAQVRGSVLPWLSHRAQSAMISTVNGPRWPKAPTWHAKLRKA